MRLVWFLLLLLPLPLTAAEPDWSVYDGLLKKYVKPGTKNNVQLAYVDYGSLKQDPAWPVALSRLEQFSPENLSSRAERLAFYINAYNLLAIKKIVDHHPLQSIKDAGRFGQVWKSTAGKIGGKDHSLDQVEHKILRPMGEPRIHFAIVCASVSCPDLRREAFRAVSLEKQLEEQTRIFLASSRGVRVDGATFQVSKILDWFAKDFQSSGGVENFVLKYRPDLKGKKMRGSIPYDWALNGR